MMSATFNKNGKKGQNQNSSDVTTDDSQKAENRDLSDNEKNQNFNCCSPFKLFTDISRNHMKDVNCDF